MWHKKISFAVLIDCELSFFFFCLKICESASAPDNASVQAVRAGSKLCGFARTGFRRARTTRCLRYRGHAPTDFEQKETAPILLASEQQTHFRSSLLSL